MSFPRYAKYKPSGVEWVADVPEHWDVVPPKRRVRTCAGGTLIKGQCADEWGDGLFPGFSASGQDVWLETPAHEGPAIVLSAVGARCGKAFKADGAWGVVANTHCIFPREGADRNFLWYVMNEESWWEKGGSAQPFVKVNETLARKWAFPPVDEQRAIAAFLDNETAKIDALVAEQERLIELLQEKRRAVISHAVTKGLNPSAPMRDSGIEWLGPVPQHWELRRISTVSTKITNGYVGPTREIFVDQGVRYLQSLHIKGNRIVFDVPYFVSQHWSELHSKSILNVGDVLVVQTGDIGQAAVVTPEFEGCNCHALIVISPVLDVLEGGWLAWLLNSEYGRQTLLSIQTGALHPHLNCGDVKDVSLPLPPVPEQRLIVNRLEGELRGFDELLGQAQHAIELLRERRTGVISAAVTGQIDVRPESMRTAA